MGGYAESRNCGFKSSLRRPLVGRTPWAWKVGQVGVEGVVPVGEGNGQETLTQTFPLGCSAEASSF